MGERGFWGPVGQQNSSQQIEKGPCLFWGRVNASILFPHTHTHTLGFSLSQPKLRKGEQERGGEGRGEKEGEGSGCLGKGW